MSTCACCRSATASPWSDLGNCPGVISLMDCALAIIVEGGRQSDQIAGNFDCPVHVTGQDRKVFRPVYRHQDFLVIRVGGALGDARSYDKISQHGRLRTIAQSPAKRPIMTTKRHETESAASPTSHPTTAEWAQADRNTGLPEPRQCCSCEEMNQSLQRCN